ncbi:MAG: hypothetical protein ACHBN1_32550 [Heteroscytonema crispum UTEX LB 1556]
MSVIICPGIHEPALTESFVSALLELNSDNSRRLTSVNLLKYPAEGFLALSGFHIVEFLSVNAERLVVRHSLSNKLESPLVFISFSAGVVGAITAAYWWQLLGGHVKAFIAIDGWGVPLWGNFPIHRMSHDYFTHWSSSLLDSRHNNDNFYADPPIDHLQMWRSPEMVQGWCVDSSSGGSPPQVRLTAAEFLYMLLKRYEEN